MSGLGSNQSDPLTLRPLAIYMHRYVDAHVQLHVQLSCSSWFVISPAPMHEREPET